MRNYRFISIFIIILLVALVVTPALSATTASQVVAPSSLLTQDGSTSGSLPTLGLLQQSNTDDTPSTYVTFSTPASRFSGYTSYQIPSDIIPNRISTFLLQVNFKGPADSVQVWSWSIFNWTTRMWIKVGDTIGTQPGIWNELNFRVRNFSPYISSTRQVRIQLNSNNANGDAKLDYLALHLTYLPSVSTPTRSIATSIPTKPVLVLPTTVTPSPTNTPTITPIPTNTITRTPTITPIAPVSSAVFAIGAGGSDVIPHQVVRTNADYLYIFVNQEASETLRIYRTTVTGLPTDALSFTTASFNEISDIISVDAIYDGGTIIHTIINLQNGQVKDYPFDSSTNTFKPALNLAANGGTVGPGMYVGTSGVSGMVDLSGNLHFTYWTSGNRIIHKMYTYNSTNNTLTQVGSDFTVDAAGSANHPSVVVSPVDGSLTVAWVSQATNPAKILTRTRAINGTWSTVDATSNTVASTSPVWISSQNGINIDQGPSLLIDSTGTKHLTYIENFCCLGDYGRVHYVTNSGSGWVDTTLTIFSHDPALALSTAGNLYIIGHGHPNNSAGDTACRSSVSMDNMCYIRKTSGGSWSNPILFATPPDNSFDSSPSVKWSAIGFNRSNAVEFIFFKTPYGTPTLYYGRLP